MQRDVTGWFLYDSEASLRRWQLTRRKFLLAGAGLLIFDLKTKTAGAARPHSTYQIVKNGHGKGRDLVVVRWETQAGRDGGKARVAVTGNGRIGPVFVKLNAMDTVPNAYEWDTREWQWWKDYPFDPGQMRPREVAVAKGGVDGDLEGIRVWTRYVCDEVETTQEWFFDDLEREDVGVYDCVITVRNIGKKTLEEYGQFFACYTAWNKSKGHFYVGADGSLVNYRYRGSRHLDYYVTAKGSLFDKLGYVPHCPRGGGKVMAIWKYPVSISHPSSRGYRHIVMTEQARTAAIAQGMQGIAQDYIIYPPDWHLNSGEVFRAQVRHLLVRVSSEELVQRLDHWWAQFAMDHQRVHQRTRPIPDAP